MQSIKSLIQELNTKEQSKLFNAFKILDDNNQELLNRIKAIEKRNLKYYCRVGRGSNQDIPDNAYTAINFDITDYPQFGNMHDNVRDNEKIFVRRTGVYHLSAGVSLESDTAGTERRLAIAVNGVRICETNYIVHALNIGPRLSVSTNAYLYENDNVTALLYQNSGGILVNVFVAGLVGRISFMPHLVVTERREDLDPSQYGLLNPEANMR
jgi:hypothetical protein